MDDLSGKLAFLDARLTLLERSVARRLAEQPGHTELFPRGHTIKVASDEPGLFISRSYACESDDFNRKFCWIGSSGPIQFVFPVAVTQAMMVSLILSPHPKVDFQDMRIFAIDQVVPYKNVEHVDDARKITFELAPKGAVHLSLVIVNLPSVCPRDLGENDDSRLLAARFFGAELTIC